MPMSLLGKHNIQVVEGTDLDWKEAIRLAAKPMLDKGTVGEDYVQSMINVVEEKGPYINIGSEIALAHARPKESVKEISLSLLKTNSEVKLLDQDEHPIRLWFVLAAVDSNSHLKVIQELSQLLMQPDKVKYMLDATTVDELLKIINEEN